MALIARVIGLSLLTAGLGVGLGFAFFGQKYPDCSLVCLFLACVAAIIGAIAGVGREIVITLRQKPPS